MAANVKLSRSSLAQCQAARLEKGELTGNEEAFSDESSSGRIEGRRHDH